MQLILEAENRIEDGMPVEGVDFDKILALLPLKMLVLLQFIPTKQRSHSYSSTSLKFSRDAKASRQKEIFLVQVVLPL